LTYSAQNPQGYSASDWRMVVVFPAASAAYPTVIANDFSGTYKRTSNQVLSTWTKVATGVYWVANPGGAVGYDNAHAVVENLSGENITIPSQDAPDFGGTISTSSETYDSLHSPTPEYSWIFNAPNFGTSLRTFDKQ